MNSIKLLKRWKDMLFGKSSFHVKQGIGKNYSKTDIKGYYNDLTGKVTNKINLDDNGIPLTTTIANITSYFPIVIFQYGLGLYDLYLETKKEEYFANFLNIANWAVENIQDDGMWDCMGVLNDSKHFTQSSMCQGEGISLLIRAYKETNNKKYMDKAKMALKFMIKDVKSGGTCSYHNNEVIFQEYVYKDIDISVLNGWIFSLFGLYDYVIMTKDKKVEEILNNSIKSLKNNLHNYDRKYWTNYDQVGTIASPAYHDIHIMQLTVLYDLFKIDEFLIFSEKWKKYQKSKLKKIRAMFIKFIQKVKKSKYYDIKTSTVEVKK